MATDFSTDRVKVDGSASDPQDRMLSRDAGVPQDDVGAWRGADTAIALFKLEAHAAMKAVRDLENVDDDETTAESAAAKEDMDINPATAILNLTSQARRPQGRLIAIGIK